jgi:hypothetical protein
MPSIGFEASTERPQTYAFDFTASWIGGILHYKRLYFLTCDDNQTKDSLTDGSHQMSYKTGNIRIT